MAKQIDLGSDDTFIENYRRLRSARKMADLYGVCVNTIKRHVKRIGLDLGDLGFHRQKDLTNQKFGKLTAIKIVGQDKNKNNLWLCKCECGRYTKVITKNLMYGNSKSCGKCFTSHTNNNGNYNSNTFVDLTGQRFGNLTALYPTKERTKWNSVVWACCCDCGNYCKVSSQHLIDGNTQSCGCLTSSNEGKIQRLFQQNNIKFRSQYTFSDLRGIGGGLLRFDFAVFNDDDSLSHLIEYNGKQHYIPS